MTGKRAIVVGAGVGGLTAAYRLQEAGLEVKVLEAGDAVGGRMRTIQKDGHTMDIGATFLSTRYTHMLSLIDDLGISSDFVPASDYLGMLRDGQLHRFHTSKRLEAARTGLLSTSAKLGMGRALVDLARNWKAIDVYNLGMAEAVDDELLSDYATRRLGTEVLDYIVKPAAYGMTLRGPHEISKVSFFWALRRVFGGGFFTSPYGVGHLPQSLADRLDVTVGQPVDEIVETNGGVRVSSGSSVEEADAVVVSVPAPLVPGIYPELDAERRHILEGIPYTQAMQVHLGLARRPAEPVSMILGDPQQYHGLMGAFLDHNKLAGRAPAGKGQLTTYWDWKWSESRVHLDDAEVVEQAVRAVEKTLPSLVQDVEMSHVERYQHAVVINTVGLCRQQSRLAAASDPRARVQLTGDYFSASTTNASLALGERAAQRVIGQLS